MYAVSVRRFTYEVGTRRLTSHAVGKKSWHAVSERRLKCDEVEVARGYAVGARRLYTLSPSWFTYAAQSRKDRGRIQRKMCPIFEKEV